MPATSLASRRYSREEFVELLDGQLGRLETEDEAKRTHSKLLQVLRSQLNDYAASKVKNYEK